MGGEEMPEDFPYQLTTVLTYLYSSLPASGSLPLLPSQELTLPTISSPYIVNPPHVIFPYQFLNMIKIPPNKIK